MDELHENYLELIDKYHDGTLPTETHLLFIYVTIEKEQCCGFYYNNNLPRPESAYFHNYFYRNCISYAGLWNPLPVPE